MSNDKDLSKPVGFAHSADLQNSQATGCYAMLYPEKRPGGYVTPTYSAEYVQSLLGKIAELQAWREEYQGKLNAEHVRVGRQYMERLEAQEKRIAELEDSHKKLRDSVAAIHNTILMDGVNTRLVGIMNAAKRAFEESKPVADGSLTVQGD